MNKDLEFPSKHRGRPAEVLIGRAASKATSVERVEQGGNASLGEKEGQSFQ